MMWYTCIQSFIFMSCYNHKQFYHKVLPEAMFNNFVMFLFQLIEYISCKGFVITFELHCCLRTCKLYFVEYSMCTKYCSQLSLHVSYTASCVPIRMYCLRLLLLQFLN